MSSTLIAHSPKFESRLVNLDALRALPEPVALGARHKPVPHFVLVDAIHRELDRRGYEAKREQLALGRKGAALFGVIDIRPTAIDGIPIVDAIPVDNEKGLSFGFRNATDGSLAIKAVAGARVFVCDNLSMSGDLFALARKNTTRLDLADAIARGFDRFLEHAYRLNLEIKRLQDTPLSDSQAKRLLYDAFAEGLLPVRLFDDVNRFYFHPTENTPETAPRTLWGAHNALTRAIQDLGPARMFSASVAIGRQFQLAAANIDNVSPF